jgi:TolB-like protein/Flp pilus assembly protein TadD
MNAVGSAEILEFEGFRLHLQDLTLWRLEHGRPEAVSLGRRAREVLVLLLEAYPAMVDRRELLKLWPDYAAPNNLDIQIKNLRREIDPNNHIIKTVYAEGFLIGVPVKRIKNTGTPPRLSIVVLPFTNLSGDRRRQYFADGVTDDLTTDLSRIEGMLVISRNTAFTYRDKPVDTKQIGRDLGVRYVLEGSVQRFGKRVRVNAQLIDAETDVHLWAERFDRDTADLFALQDEITSRIAVALNLELVADAAARSTDNPDASDYILRGRAAYWKPPAPGSFGEAIGWFERALALNPRSVNAQSWLAVALLGRVLDYMSDSAAADTARAEELVRQALAVLPRSALAHYGKGQVLRTQNRFDEAISEYETVLGLDHNWVFAITNLGWCKLLTGSIEEAIELHKRAIRLSPRDPRIGNWYYRIGLVHLLQSRIDEAIDWFESARNVNPAHAGPYAHLASAYALKGNTERAVSALAEARRLSRDGRFLSMARLKAAQSQYFASPKISVLFENIYLTGLRKAGVVEDEE